MPAARDPASIRGMSPPPGLAVFRTAEHPCGYFPDRVASDHVLDPGDPRLPLAYGEAVARGFRRSGGIVYIPRCAACQACVGVRIPAAEFRPDRSQRRCERRNADIDLAFEPAVRSDEVFALYQRYLGARHAGGGMDGGGPEDFDQFLAAPWSPTRFLTMRRAGVLLGVAVTDLLNEGLSAVYTFFEPDEAARSLGTFAILAQLRLARRAGLPHVYLGFWIAGHPKMDYKRRFRPLEGFDGRGWRRLEA